jgi:SOS-response transcriptional repressor LexA
LIWNKKTFSERSFIIQEIFFVVNSEIENVFLLSKKGSINMIFNEELKAFRKEKKLSQQDFADSLGITTRTLYNYEEGKSYPSLEIMNRLQAVYNLRIELLADEDDEFSAQEQKYIKKYRVCDERGKGMVDTVLDYEYNRTLDLLNKNDIKQSEPIITVQVPYESMAAGFGNYLSDSSYEEIDFPVSKIPNGTDYGIRISGDSMNPTIPDGCIAFIRSRPAIENGKIGVFSLNGEGYCKRLEVDSENHTIWLVSDNEKYEPIKVGLEDYLHTYGEVLGWAVA